MIETLIVGRARRRVSGLPDLQGLVPFVDRIAGEKPAAVVNHGLR